MGIPENRKEDRDMKVVDMHCDTIAEIYKDHERGGRQSILENRLMLDLRKMQAGDYGLQNFAEKKGFLAVSVLQHTLRYVSANLHLPTHKPITKTASQLNIPNRSM